MELTDIYNARSIKDAARLKLARWFNKVEKLGVDNFYTVIDTFKNHYDTILNFFVNRATNANADKFYHSFTEVELSEAPILRKDLK